MAMFDIREQPVGTPGEAYLFQHLIWAHALSGALLAATELDLFTALDAGPATAAELAARCGTVPEWTGKLLTACAAMGLVEGGGGRWRNTAVADRYLVRGRPAYQGDVILHLRHWERWMELAHTVRTGQRGPRDAQRRAAVSAADRAAAHRTWIMAMHQIAMAGQAEALAAALDLAGRHRLCDVGGGPGTYAAVLCRRYPQLAAVVLDLPETEPICRQVADAFGVADRLQFRPADYLQDDYGMGNDVVLLSGVLHGETADDCRRMLRKAHNSLVPGGLVVVQENLLHENRAGPLLPALFSLHMTGGAAYTGGEVAGWMAEAGLAGARVVPLDGYSWLNSLVIGQRP